MKSRHQSKEGREQSVEAEEQKKSLKAREREPREKAGTSARSGARGAAEGSRRTHSKHHSGTATKTEGNGGKESARAATVGKRRGGGAEEAAAGEQAEETPTGAKRHSNGKRQRNPYKGGTAEVARTGRTKANPEPKAQKERTEKPRRKAEGERGVGAKQKSQA